jgi:hypothetical protein
MAVAIAAALIALVVVSAWPGGGPDGTVVGAVDDFAVGQPVHLEKYGIWVVVDDLGRFLAFSDDDPRTPGEHDCRVEWNEQRVVNGVQGVFETCGGYQFHPGGPAFPGVAPEGPGFYPASVNAGNVVVNFDEPYCNTQGIIYPDPCHGLGARTLAPRPAIVPLGY